MSGKSEKSGKAGDSLRARRRRRPSKDLGEILSQVDSELIAVTEGGRRKRMSSLEVQIRTTFNAALGGDLTAAGTIFRMVQEYGLQDPNEEQEYEFVVLPDEYWQGKWNGNE